MAKRIGRGHRYSRLAGRVAGGAGRAIRWELAREARGSVPGMIYGSLRSTQAVAAARRSARRNAPKLFRYGVRGPLDVGYGASAIAAGVSKMGFGGARVLGGIAARSPSSAGKGAIQFFSGARHFRSGIRHLQSGLYRTSGRRGRGSQIGHPFYGNQYVHVAPRGGPQLMPARALHLRPAAYRGARRISARRRMR